MDANNNYRLITFKEEITMYCLWIVSLGRTLSIVFLAKVYRELLPSYMHQLFQIICKMEKFMFDCKKFPCMSDERDTFFICEDFILLIASEEYLLMWFIWIMINFIENIQFSLFTIILFNSTIQQCRYILQVIVFSNS